MENSFFQLTENECYFFSYGTLNIDSLSNIFKRERNSILYQNCVLHNYCRIFCNENIVSIHQDNYSVYGIVIKITKNELKLLERYHENYSLHTVRVNYTSCIIDSIKLIVNDDSSVNFKEVDNEILTPYVFIYDNYINNNLIKPSNECIQQIRKMFDDRHLIEKCKKIKMRLFCVVKNNIEIKEEEQNKVACILHNVVFYYPNVSNEEIRLIGYENI